MQASHLAHISEFETIFVSNLYLQDMMMHSSSRKAKNYCNCQRQDVTKYVYLSTILRYS